MTRKFQAGDPMEFLRASLAKGADLSSTTWTSRWIWSGGDWLPATIVTTSLKRGRQNMSLGWSGHVETFVAKVAPGHYVAADICDVNRCFLFLANFTKHIVLLCQHYSALSPHGETTR
jgi:hypothetical protein